MIIFGIGEACGFRDRKRDKLFLHIALADVFCTPIASDGPLG